MDGEEAIVCVSGFGNTKVRRLCTTRCVSLKMLPAPAPTRRVVSGNMVGVMKQNLNKTHKGAERKSSVPNLALRLVRVGAGLIGLAVLFSMWASPDRLLSLPWFILAMIGVALVLVVTGRWLPFIASKVSRSALLHRAVQAADVIDVMVGDDDPPDGLGGKADLLKVGSKRSRSAGETGIDQGCLAILHEQAEVHGADWTEARRGHLNDVDAGHELTQGCLLSLNGQTVWVTRGRASGYQRS